MRRKYIPKEEVEQEIFAAWCDLQGLCWFHVPNEGKKHIAYHVKMKKQGLKKGVPDNFIIDHPPKQPEHKGCVVELKREKGGKTSAEQLQWIEDLQARGWYAAVCNGAKEAIALLESLGYGARKANL